MISERRLAYASLIPGILLSAALSRKDEYFAANFFFFLLPQLAVIAGVCLIRPRPGIVAGCALVLFAYLGIYAAWLFSRPHPESMAWLGYVFSVPGALVGAISYGLWSVRRQAPSISRTVAYSAAAVLAGLAVFQGALCSTLMYCRL
ncbi:hypothetical protein MJ904_24405 [Massilia sp. MB5]|uniref:hypothetical protein n=1 Tax=unclassified Massilia TaxID=2609279 RepID=UPI0012378266|nr:MULTISPECIES: hypothetical protein [unclassified Massilia]UMR30116.1 hypothetical protein MJ904_24405 [Massilia sp. MB5]